MREEHPTCKNILAQRLSLDTDGERKHQGDWLTQVYMEKGLLLDIGRHYSI